MDRKLMEQMFYEGVMPKSSAVPKRKNTMIP